MEILNETERFISILASVLTIMIFFTSINNAKKLRLIVSVWCLKLYRISHPRLLPSFIFIISVSSLFTLSIINDNVDEGRDLFYDSGNAIMFGFAIGVVCVYLWDPKRCWRRSLAICALLWVHLAVFDADDFWRHGDTPLLNLILSGVFFVGVGAAALSIAGMVQYVVTTGDMKLEDQRQSEMTRGQQRRSNIVRTTCFGVIANLIFVIIIFAKWALYSVLNL